LRHGSLFSGIGGFDLAAEWMGWDNVFHCEWNPFGQKILHHYWPNAIQYNDITKTDFSVHRGTIDILTGGFPCQPYSMAGKRLGKEDDRHLWPEMLRAIRKIQPTWVVGENVLGIANWNGGLVFDEVQADLEAEGYEVQPYVLPAVAVDAPHRRDRVWFVAYAKGRGAGIIRDKRSKERTCNSNELFGGKCAVSSENGNAADSETTQNTLCSGRAHGEHEQERAEVWEQRNIGPGGADGIHLSKGDAADSKDKRLQGFGGYRENSKTQRNIASICPMQGIGFNDAPESNQERPLSRKDSRKNGRDIKDDKFKSSLCNDRIEKRDTWENFPTQSPVCSGDDGLSTQLDGITFSKWRNESIKGYGNAVVPQVVYQIFKTIELYEQQRIDQVGDMDASKGRMHRMEE
jgi:DNA (cytosine-5)-methyltransferase 1